MPARTARAVGAGLAGAVAYLLAQQVDRRIANPNSNDLVLLGGPFTSRPRLRLLVGLVLHLVGGASMGLFFERYARERLWGPTWLRGIALLQIENTALFPLVWGMDKGHPAVKSGDLAPMWSRVYFAQQAWRHLALGAVMGAVLGSPPETIEPAAPQTDLSRFPSFAAPR